MSKQEVRTKAEQGKQRQERQGVSSAFIDRIISAQENNSHRLEN